MVLIMLATYNGEKYLRQQLDSIYNQTYKDFDILISDDNSTDNTISIIEEFLQQKNNIKLIHNNDKHGALYNFSYLVEYAKGMRKYDYYMFSDQDDIWLEKKIELSLITLKEQNVNRPALLYTSKQYVNSELEKIDYVLCGEEHIGLNLLLQNRAYGCTFLLNHLLFNKLDYTISSKFVNYDHYVVLCAFMYGKVFFLNEKTILYRQHTDNVSGIIHKSLREKLNIIKKYKQCFRTFLFLLDFLKSNYNLLNDETKIIVDELFNNKDSKKLIMQLVKNKIFLNSFWGNLQLYIYIFLFGKSSK